MLSVVNYSSYRQDLYTSHGTFQGGVGRGVQKLKFVKKNMKVSWNFQLAGCRLWGRGGCKPFMGGVQYIVFQEQHITIYNTG